MVEFILDVIFQLDFALLICLLCIFTLRRGITSEQLVSLLFQDFEVFDLLEIYSDYDGA